MVQASDRYTGHLPELYTAWTATECEYPYGYTGYSRRACIASEEWLLKQKKRACEGEFQHVEETSKAYKAAEKAKNTVRRCAKREDFHIRLWAAQNAMPVLSCHLKSNTLSVGRWAHGIFLCSKYIKNNVKIFDLN